MKEARHKIAHMITQFYVHEGLEKAKLIHVRERSDEQLPLSRGGGRENFLSEHNVGV